MPLICAWLAACGRTWEMMNIYGRGKEVYLWFLRRINASWWPAIILSNCVMWSAKPPCEINDERLRRQKVHGIENKLNETTLYFLSTAVFVYCCLWQAFFFFRHMYMFCSITHVCWSIRLCKSTWGHCSIYNRKLPAGFSYRRLYLQLDEGSLTFNANPQEVTHAQTSKISCPIDAHYPIASAACLRVCVCV